MNRRIYRKIAKKHGISLSEVKRDMEIAIQVAYLGPNQDIRKRAAQNAVPRKGAVPTADELIRYAVQEVERQNNKNRL